MSFKYALYSTIPVLSNRYNWNFNSQTVHFRPEASNSEPGQIRKQHSINPHTLATFPQPVHQHNKSASYPTIRKY